MRTTAIALICFVLLTACNTEQHERINIAVYPSTKSCSIKDKVLDCSQLGAYLRDTVKAGVNREITVSFAGSETITPENKSVDRIAESIRKAGYTNVKVIRFDL